MWAARGRHRHRAPKLFCSFISTNILPACRALWRRCTARLAGDRGRLPRAWCKHRRAWDGLMGQYWLLASTKHLGGFGSGGACTTNNPELAERMQQLVGTGSQGHGFSHTNAKGQQLLVKGVNERLDELQAALLRVQLPATLRRVDVAAHRTCCRVFCRVQTHPSKPQRCAPTASTYLPQLRGSTPGAG